LGPLDPIWVEKACSRSIGYALYWGSRSLPGPPAPVGAEVGVQRESPQQLGRRRLLGGLLVAAVVLVWLVWWQWDAIGGWLAREETAPVVPPSVSEPAPPPADAAEEPAEPENESARRWTELIGSPPTWPEDLSAPASCEEVENDLVRVCRAVDAALEREQEPVPGGFCALLSQTATALAARQPRTSAELRSYPTILANTFHLFRVLGAQRMGHLRRAAAVDTDLAEPAALALYRWLASRPKCARSGDTPLRREALYAYAAFLFRTLGGQAYLRRRSPRVEALTGFYGLLILDAAIDQGYNPEGVDPRPELSRTRALIELQPLVFRDRYLEILGRMESRWDRKGEIPPA
jgi:hypothetical protein